ncbi:MAG: carbamoyltransferase HypF [Rhodocyclaceae bacterium]|nr:MAG: carbamoyltransferase HypF [Rhodocyclaceae bacterium]
MHAAQRIRVTGLVQGVGFRPFVWRLAQELELKGWVRNDARGVEIAAEGDARHLQSLLLRLKSDAPPLARVEDVQAVAAQPEGRAEFVIAESGGGAATTAIGHDTGICNHCLAEMFDPAGRRWRHAFITCTHCGPRYTLSRGLPYDRARTSMAGFPLCADCGKEYADPADRRFHAETACCPNCGPQLRLLDWHGEAVAGDPIAETLRRLKVGDIIAIKGLGGFHLVCDARNGDAVARLRQRKQREEKPFAIMAANVASLADRVVLDAAALALLHAPERPIVLLKKRACADAALPGVAPGLAWLGAMLPYTPLQWLLFHEAAGRPAGTAWLQGPQALTLVMTSANPGGEPLVTDNDEALVRLSGIADAFLLHDRDIVVRCDDSVVRVIDDSVRPARSAQGEVEGQATESHQGPSTSSGRTEEEERLALPSFQFIRRARGYTPRPIKLAAAGPSVLAVGGGLKNTVCVTRGDEAFVSQHIGDLDNAAACGFFEETVAHLLDVLQVRPEIVAQDLHPDFHSSRYAGTYAERHGLPLVGVQHHHAHIAAVAAEHQHSGPLLGLALDGIGHGSDGGAWGGELLRVDGSDFRRLGHLHELPLPGSDRAAREPWRMAAAALHVCGRDDQIAGRFAHQAAAPTVAQMLARRLNTPLTSSTGRLFDAAAGLLGVRDIAAYEGQAAMLLEGLAEGVCISPLEANWVNAETGALDLCPLLAALFDEDDARRGAALFHTTLAAALAEWVIAAAEREQIKTIALGGGCFLNQILTSKLRSQLNDAGLRVLEAQRIPPGDGGISLGQAWVALNKEF